MSNWIDVNDRLPEQTTPVIIWTSVSIFAAMGLYSGDTWIYATVSTNFLTKSGLHVKAE